MADDADALPHKTHTHLCQELNAELQILSDITLKLRVVSIFTILDLQTHFSTVCRYIWSHFVPRLISKIALQFRV